MNKFNNVNTLEILKRILRDNRIGRETCTIIITGRSGPTGKTWLCNELVKNGYRAMEMSPLFHSLNLKDDGINHVVVDDSVDQVIVVLNEILPMYLNKGYGGLRFNPDDVYMFETRAEAENVLFKMKQIAEQYGSVERADFKELIDMEIDARVDCGYGWVPSTIVKARVVRSRLGFFIEFPQALPIR